MNNMTTFYIVRHGETDWNAQKLIQGTTDIPLNSTGELQAKALATELKDIKFDLVFSSDLLRTKKTAEIIAAEHRLEVALTKLLRERTFGKFEGQKREALNEYDKLLETLSHEERMHHKQDDMESDAEVATRCITFLRETALTHPNKTILSVSHAHMMRTLLIHLGAATYGTLHRGGIGNTAYVKLLSDGVDFFVKETKGIEGIKTI